MRNRKAFLLIAIFKGTREGPTMTMSRVYAALIASAVTAMALPTAASAQCQGCYVPPQPCVTCYQRQVAPAEYRTVDETVMVAPAREYYVATQPRCSTCGY